MQNNLPLDELRQCWRLAWGREPSLTIGRTMLTESLKYKEWESTSGGLSKPQQQRLNRLIRDYKRNPSCFDKVAKLKPGMRLERNWKGRKHCVTVLVNGFEYNHKTYKSLSQIANLITGTRWNGWVFFGVQ